MVDGPSGAGLEEPMTAVAEILVCEVVEKSPPWQLEDLVAARFSHTF